MPKTIYPLDYILKLLLDGKVQEGTQALSDYVEDQKQKRGKAGRAGSREKKSEAAKRRWEARQGRGSEAATSIDTLRMAEEARQACNKHTPEQRAAGVKRAMEIINGAVRTGPKLPAGVMRGSEMEGRG